jgi:DNA-binding response OmpR family regulator
MVDPDDGFLVAIQGDLQKYEYQVYGAQSYERAMSHISNITPDMSVISEELPDDGCNRLFRKLRSQNPHSPFPIFIASKQYLENHYKFLGQMLDGGPDLIKPFGAIELHNLIQDRIDRHRRLLKLQSKE